MAYKKPEYFNFWLDPDGNPDHQDFSEIFGDVVSRNCPILTGDPLRILPELRVKRDEHYEAIDISCTGAVSFIDVLGRNTVYHECYRCGLRDKKAIKYAVSSL